MTAPIQPTGTPEVTPPVAPPAPIPAAVAAAVGIDPATPAADKHTMQLRQLAAKEAELRNLEASIKQREGEYTKFQSEQTAWKQRHEKAKTDPDAVLSEYGWDFDKYVKFRLNQNKLEPQDQVSIEMKTLNDKLAALDAKQAELDRVRAEEATARETANKASARQQAISGVGEFLKEGGEKYELTATYGWQESVLDLFAAEHQNGMTLEEAAQKVEAHLEGEMKKLLATKKFQSLGTPASEPKTDLTVAKITPKANTLTNRMTTRTETAKPVDRASRVAEAIKLLRTQQ